MRGWAEPVMGVVQAKHTVPSIVYDKVSSRPGQGSHLLLGLDCPFSSLVLFLDLALLAL